jgi:hypothetical protein
VLLDDATGLDAGARAVGVDVTMEEWLRMVYMWHWSRPTFNEAEQAIAGSGEFVCARIGKALDSREPTR